MYKIAIVEDSIEDRNALLALLGKYEKEHQASFSVSSFPDGLKFYGHYETGFDIVFTDIEMPLMDGMEAAKKIRDSDKRVQIIFVSKSAQYAVKGYEADAIGYALKPVTYFVIEELLDKAIKKLSLILDSFLLVNTDEEVVRIPIPSLQYIEVRDHYLFYHVSEKVYRSRRSSLAEEEKKLSQKGFSKCNNCYLVNLRHVVSIGKDSIMVGKEMLAMSRGKKAEFKDAFVRFAGEYL
ncbi:MAG: LytTR family DNA-binding domain-containing protein [Bacilli bacterium]|jgi:DNA-binding LytR/AlgR family response regulator|nr:LytTR family DNA-binding domain-containing protein [Bacilli bacterium]